MEPKTFHGTVDNPENAARHFGDTFVLAVENTSGYDRTQVYESLNYLLEQLYEKKYQVRYLSDKDDSWEIKDLETKEIVCHVQIEDGPVKEMEPEQIEF